MTVAYSAMAALRMASTIATAVSRYFSSKRSWVAKLSPTRHCSAFSSHIATSSLKYATHFKRYAQAGMVLVNLPTAGVDYHVPFGGRKGSSYGPREQGSYAKEFYTTVKTAYSLA